MRTPTLVCALLALAAPAAATAMGFGNKSPVVDSVTTSPAEVQAGATVTLQCVAHDPDGVIAQMSATVSGGTLPGGVQSAPLAFASGPSTTGTIAWTLPPEPGSFTVTCLVKDGASWPASASASATMVSSAAVAAPIVTLAGPAAAILGGSTISLMASASDPAGGELVYTWSATGGALAGAGPSVAWTAPAEAASFVVKVTARSAASGAESSAQVSIPVFLASAQGALSLPLVAPRQIRSASGGDLYLVDRQAGGEGQVLLLTARGEARGLASVPEPVLAVARGPGVLWAATESGNLYKLDPLTGRNLGQVRLADGPFSRPLALAYDARRMALWVADAAADRVRVIRPDGETVAVLEAAGAAPLRGPLDVAIDAAAGRAWVLVSGAKGSLAAGEPVELGRLVHGFDLDGTYRASIVPQGGAAGTVSRAGGLATGPDGRVYVADAFQGVVQVFRPDGAPLGPIGGFGEGPGELMTPGSLALLANGDVAVASTTQGRVERFGSGAPLPVCDGDTDCDGLPDAWELANGLNPRWAGDALADLDGDGLVNAEELAYGTDPRKADTDGDGYSDRDELAAGFDPRDPSDHRPVLVAAAPAAVDPGLVRIAATLSGAGACAVEWSQVAGPVVELRGQGTVTPSFVARAAATYAIEGIAVCGGLASAPVRVAVEVRNVPPRADAGRIVVVRGERDVELDGLASSDANGDALTFLWDQTLGRALTSGATGPILPVRAREPGLYAFQLTARDPAGLSASAEVPVLVVSGVAPTALARAAPAAPAVGDAVLLDASASVVPPGGAFAWTQVAGQEVALEGAAEAVATFLAPAPGHYAFDVAVASDRTRSPPARVDVWVADEGRALPRADVSAPDVVPVNAPVELDGTRSAGAGLAWSWRQVAGPAAGLADADRPVATVLPFEPGFYAFELVVRDGAAESRPARVTFEARSGGRPIPLARGVASPAAAVEQQLVLLDGRASAGAVRHRWTQVAGPWAVIDDAGSPVASVRPPGPGTYVFELEVDDGRTRSAPARVEVVVTKAGGKR